MHYSNVVTVGDKVDLTKESGLGEETGKKQYVSQVLDLVDTNKAIIAMPMENGRVIPLSIGDKYKGFFHTAKGMFLCRLEIMERYKEDNIYVLLVQYISEFEKYQRRQYFRLEMLKNIEARLITPQEEIIEKKIEEDNFESELTKHKFVNTLNAMRANWVGAVATDLSGGGMRFNANMTRSNEESVAVKMNFSVGNRELEYELRAAIVAVTIMPNKTGYYEYRIRFTDITKEERENLIKYIFEEERKRRKNNL